MDRNNCNNGDVFNANQLEQAELARQYYEDIVNHNHQQHSSHSDYLIYRHRRTRHVAMNAAFQPISPIIYLCK